MFSVAASCVFSGSRQSQLFNSLFCSSLLHEINTQDWNSSVSDNMTLSLYKSVKIDLFMKTILMYSMLENLDIVMLNLE